MGSGATREEERKTERGRESGGSIRHKMGFKKLTECGRERKEGQKAKRKAKARNTQCGREDTERLKENKQTNKQTKGIQNSLSWSSLKGGEEKDLREQMAVKATHTP